MRCVGAAVCEHDPGLLSDDGAAAVGADDEAAPHTPLDAVHAVAHLRLRAGAHAHVANPTDENGARFLGGAAQRAARSRVAPAIRAEHPRKDLRIVASGRLGYFGRPGFVIRHPPPHHGPTGILEDVGQVEPLGFGHAPRRQVFASHAVSVLALLLQHGDAKAMPRQGSGESGARYSPADHDDIAPVARHADSVHPGCCSDLAEELQGSCKSLVRRSNHAYDRDDDHQHSRD